MNEEAQPFEKIYRELEQSVQRLEEGDLPLAESLALFERCATLAEQCNALLDAAELHVRELTTRVDGSLAAQPFDSWQSE
jgi:exodeoxyribonuclease VII small subunit